MMLTLLEERKEIEDGIKMMRKAQLDRLAGMQEILVALERLYDDIRTVGLQMKSARHREKLSKDCKFFSILLELVAQAMQSATDHEELAKSLGKIYAWYKENSSQLQLAERPVFQSMQSHLSSQTSARSVPNKIVVIPSQALAEWIPSRSPTRVPTSSSYQEPPAADHVSAPKTLAESTAMSPEPIILDAQEGCVSTPEPDGDRGLTSLPGLLADSNETSADEQSLTSSTGLLSPAPGRPHDHSSFIERVTSVNAIRPALLSGAATGSRGLTPRKYLPSVSVHLEVNKVIGHPSDVYPELFTQLLVGSYVADMGGAAVPTTRLKESSSPRWQHQSLEEFLAESEKARTLPRSSAKVGGSVKVGGSASRSSGLNTSQRLPSSLQPRRSDGDSARHRRQPFRSVSQGASHACSAPVPGSAPGRALHLGDVVGMADFASAEISYEKTVDMLLAGAAVSSGFIQPTFSLLQKSKSASQPSEANRRGRRIEASAGMPGQEALAKLPTAPGPQRRDAIGAAELAGAAGGTASRSSSNYSKVSDDGIAASQPREERSSSCPSQGRLLKNMRTPLGNPEDIKASEVNERVAEAASHQTTEVNESAVSQLFQVQRMGRANRFKSGKRYQADKYFDPLLPLPRPREDKEVSFHDEESYCYYEASSDTETTQESADDKCKREYINFVTPFSSLIKSALRAQSKPVTAAPPSRNIDTADEESDRANRPAAGAAADASDDPPLHARDAVDESAAICNENVEYPDDDRQPVDAAGEPRSPGRDAPTTDDRALTVTPSSSHSPPASARQRPAAVPQPPPEEEASGARSRHPFAAADLGALAGQPKLMLDRSTAAAALGSSLTAMRFDGRGSARETLAAPTAAAAEKASSGGGKRASASVLHRRAFALYRTSPSIPTPYSVSSGADSATASTSTPRKVYIPELERAARSQMQSCEYVSTVNSLRNQRDQRNRSSYSALPQGEQLEDTLLVRSALSRFSS